MGSRIETWLLPFPSGFVEGELFAKLQSRAEQRAAAGEFHDAGIDVTETPDILIRNKVEREHVARTMGKDENDGMVYRNVKYRKIIDEEDTKRDEFFEAILRGDEDYVRQALALQKDEDGLHLNLHITCSHPGFPAVGSCPAAPAHKDRRRYQLKDRGVAMIARCLPTGGLRSVILQLGRNAFTSTGLLELLNAIPNDLEDLKLYISGNDIRNRGCIAISDKLVQMSRLKCLHLALGANRISDQGHDKLLECIPRQLRQLHVSFRWSPLRYECAPAREKMWQLGDELKQIKLKNDPRDFFIMY